jgi:PAS domain S-box-containing protein
MLQWNRAFQFQHWKQRHYLLAVFAFSTFLLVSFAIVLYRQSSVVERHDKWVLHSYDVLHMARRLYTHALDAETGQRGYLLTGKAVFLEPYKKALSQLDGEMEKLVKATVDNPNQQQSLSIMRSRMDELLQLLDTQIQLYEHHGIQALSKKDLMDSRSAMDDVRAQIDVITSDELGVLRERISLSRQEQRNYVTTLFVGSGLSLIGLMLANLVIFSLLSHTRSTEARLRSFEDRLRLVQEGVKDGIYEFDVATRNVLLSASYLNLLGFNPQDLNGDIANFERILHPDDLQRMRDAAEKYLAKKSAHFAAVCRMQHRDGGWRWILARGVGEWDERTGKPIRLVGTHTDITEQKLREEELRQMNQDLESFTYIASHDLRSPLVNLKGFAGEIEYALQESCAVISEVMQDLPETQQNTIKNSLYKDIPESIGYIRSAVEKMDKLTTAILDMSRIGRRQFRYEEVDLEPVIRRCLDAVAYEVSNKNIHIEVGPMPTVKSDPVMLEQIISNIMDNAIKYLRPDVKGEIHIRANLLEHGYEFHISDNGRGISQQDRSKVFNIFRRASNVGEVRGAGMGMAFVKALIRKLGGRIWFTSTLNEGTTFSFVLPKELPEHVRQEFDYNEEISV